MIMKIFIRVALLVILWVTALRWGNPGLLTYSLLALFSLFVLYYVLLTSTYGTTYVRLRILELRTCVIYYRLRRRHREVYLLLDKIDNLIATLQYLRKINEK